MKLPTTQDILADYPAIRNRTSAIILAENIIDSIKVRDDRNSAPIDKGRATKLISSAVDQLVNLNQGASFWQRPDLLPMGGKIRTNSTLEPVEPEPDSEGEAWEQLLDSTPAQKRRMRGRPSPLPRH